MSSYVVDQILLSPEQFKRDVRLLIQEQKPVIDCLDTLQRLLAQLVKFINQSGPQEQCFEMYQDILYGIDEISQIYEIPYKSEFDQLKRKMNHTEEIQEILFHCDDDKQEINAIRRFNSKLFLRHNKMTSDSQVCNIDMSSDIDKKFEFYQSQQILIEQIKKQEQLENDKNKHLLKIVELKNHEISYLTSEKQIGNENSTPQTEIQFIQPYSDIKQLFEKSLLENEDIRLDDSFKTLLELEIKLSKLSNQDMNRFHQEFPNYEDFNRDIKKKYHYLQDNLKELNSSGWIVDKDKDGIKVSYKFPENTPTVSILMESVVDVEPIKLAALFNECEFYYLYVPFCHKAYLVKELSKSIKVCVAEIYFPIVPNRETIFVGEGIDRLNENGTFILTARSIDQDKEFQQQFNVPVPEKSKMVRLEFKFYIFEILPLDRKSCRIRAVTNVNPHLNSIPQSIISFIARKFAYTLFEKIVKYAKNFEQSPWYKKYQEKQDFYGWVNGKIESFFQQKSP